MNAAPYLIELSKHDGGPSLRSRLGFDLVDFIYEMVPPDAEPATVPIRVISRATKLFELPDHLGDANGFHVVSDRMRSLLDAVVKDTKFFSATVELTKPSGRDTDIGGGPIIEGFWWVHCWRALDIVAWNDSEIAEIPARCIPSQYKGKNPSIRFATWQELALKTPPPDEHYFGILGLKGGRRFFSPELWNTLKRSGLKVSASPMFLDNRRPFDSVARDAAIREVFHGWQGK